MQGFLKKKKKSPTAQELLVFGSREGEPDGVAGDSLAVI